MKKNRLVIAAAGSGKTSFLVKQALAATGNVLITTFTEANEEEIRSRLIEKNGFIPKTITIQTWFAFLIQHGVKPYQGHCFDTEVKGMNLIAGRSAKFMPETDSRFYLDPDQKLYSDKIAQLLTKCDNLSGGKVIDRLSRIYPTILIDEIQDMSGYDLEFLRLLFASKITLLMVGDPRQGVYSTSNSGKHKKFKKASIVSFFENEDVEIDDTLLTINFRCIKPICDLSNELYPDLTPVTSGNQTFGDHHGVFLVRSSDVKEYLAAFEPMQLRDSSKTDVDEALPVATFGKSKGLAYERVLIYPSGPMTKWLKDRAIELTPGTRSRLYVGVTRARSSVAFVFDYKDGAQLFGTACYAPNLISLDAPLVAIQKIAESFDDNLENESENGPEMQETSRAACEGA